MNKLRDEEMNSLKEVTEKAVDDFAKAFKENKELKKEIKNLNQYVNTKLLKIYKYILQCFSLS